MGRLDRSVNISQEQVISQAMLKFKERPDIMFSFFGDGKFSFDGSNLSWTGSLKMWINNINKTITGSPLAITADYQFIYVTVDDWVTNGSSIPINKISYVNVNDLTENDIIIGFVTQQGAGKEAVFHMLYGLAGGHRHDGEDSHLISHDYRCRVYQSIAQSIPNAAWTAVQFDAENYDPKGMHDPVTNNSRITIPTGGDGTYKIVGGFTFAANATGARIAKIRLNNLTDLVFNIEPNHGAVYSSGDIIATLEELVGGDYIEIYVRQDSGAALNLSADRANTFLSLIREA